MVLGVLSPSDVKNVPAWQQPLLLLPPGWGEAMKPFGDGFIKLIKMLIAPIIFCTVVHGIASMENMRKVGQRRPQGADLFRGRHDGWRWSIGVIISTSGGRAPA